LVQKNLSNDDPTPTFSPENGIAVVELADELQIRKQTIFKVMKRLGIQDVKRREPDRRGQYISIISRHDADIIRDELRKAASVNGSAGVAGDARCFSEDSGVFYLVQLEPNLDPGRFKVGFTTDIDGRLRHHRCSAPFAQCLKIWPCRRTWERAAIDCVTVGTEQLHTEVFRSDSLQIVIDRAEKFFSLMPIATDPSEAESEDYALTDDDA
jgi:hypothetical protein